MAATILRGKISGKNLPYNLGQREVNLFLAVGAENDTAYVIINNLLRLLDSLRTSNTYPSTINTIVKCERRLY